METLWKGCRKSLLFELKDVSNRLSPPTEKQARNKGVCWWYSANNVENESTFLLYTCSQLWHQLSLNIFHLLLTRWLRTLAYEDVKIYLFNHIILQLTQYLISHFSHHNQPCWFIYLSLSLSLSKLEQTHYIIDLTNIIVTDPTTPTLSKPTTANILKCTNSKPI